MNSFRKNAVIVGILLIACTAATILSALFSGSVIDDSDYLTRLSANETTVIIGALFEFIWAATAMGIAIGLYPVLEKPNQALALGAVGFRVLEGVFILIGTLCLLVLLTLSQEFVSAGAPVASDYQTAGTLLLAARNWAHNVITLIAFGTGALLYYWVLYQSKLIPRWLSGWGFLGAVFSLAATLLSLFKPDFAVSVAHTVVNAPIAFNEIVLAVWLIVKGFNQTAITSLQ